MKTFIAMSIIMTLFIPSLIFAVEKASRISDREIIERLARVEEGQKAGFDAIDKRFEDLNAQLNRLAAIFTAIVVFTLGFAIWDRRTMVRPFEDKVKKIEDEITRNQGKLHDLIDALKSLSKTDEKVAEVLKKFNLL